MRVLKAFFGPCSGLAFSPPRDSVRSTAPKPVGKQTAFLQALIHESEGIMNKAGQIQLSSINTGLAKQWHSSKNDSLTPKDVTPYSEKKAWWLCDRGHEWQATVSNRSRGRGCPYWTGRAVCDDNCLHTLKPVLAAEWHTVKNGSLTPKNVTSGSSKRVWWMCKAGHEWTAIISSRSQGYGRCPYCSERRKA